MSLLLDTQIFLWIGSDPARLGSLLDMITDRSTRILLSAASVWEISIKQGLGKLVLPEPTRSFIPTRMSSSEVSGLPITHAHAIAVADLPSHHRDPFDRMLLAQAMVEELVIATADPVFGLYTDRLLRP